MWYHFFMQDFSVRLKQLRVEKGITQKQASEALGLSKNTFGNYELGIREPSLDVLKKICLLFDVSSDYLLGLSDGY